MAIKILLADDSITIQKIIGIILGGPEYSLSVVDNGISAVEKAREILPDIMLIDVNMPGLDGYQVCEAARKIPLLSGTPLILLTNSFDPFDEEKARLSGCSDRITKPFDSQTVLSKIKELLASRGIEKKESLSAETAAGTGTDSEVDGHGYSPIDPNDIWGAFTAAPEAPSDKPASSAGVEVSDFFPAETHIPFSVPENDKAAFPGKIGQIILPDAESIAVPNLSQPETAIPCPVEEKSRAAISAISREVVERVAREVIPDLAEKIIRETIREMLDRK